MLSGLGFYAIGVEDEKMLRLSAVVLERVANIVVIPHWLSRRGLQKWVCGFLLLFFYLSSTTMGGIFRLISPSPSLGKFHASVLCLAGRDVVPLPCAQESLDHESGVNERGQEDAGREIHFGSGLGDGGELCFCDV